MALAHNCAIVGVSFDFGLLYSGGDPDYELCLQTLVDAVQDTKRAAER